MKDLFPWLIALLACMTLMVSNGLSITGLPVYDEALLSEFGWSRGQLKFRDLITLGLTGILAPFAGIAIDRFGVRRCMMVGWLVLIGAYIMYSNMNSLVDMYIVHALLCVVLVFCGLNAGVILVSHWFEKRRGTAIGITLVGTSLGGMIFPQYGTAMLEAVGWRGAMLTALVFPALMLLLTIFIIRDRPAASSVQAGAETQADATFGVDYLVAIRTPTFWALALIAMATFYTVLGMQAHLFLYMRDLNFTPARATNMVSLFFLCALVGKFVFGVLADSFDRQRVFYINMLVMLSGALAFAAMQPTWVVPAVIVIGGGWGGVYSMIQLSVMNCFGLRAAGKILGTITILDALGGGLGIWLSGVLYDYTDSYRLAFAIFAGMVAFSLLCLTQVRQVVPTASPALR